MKLSVCVITYNHEEFIEQAISAALNQHVNFDYEIVVGEDCSTDATADILRKLEALRPQHLKVIYRQKNIGARENLKDTLAICQGEYVAFLEADDFWTSPQKLQRQVDFLEKHKDASLCFHRTRSLNMLDQSAEFVVPATDPAELSSFSFLIQDSNPVATATVVARRAYLADFRTWLGNVKPGDWLLWMMLAKQGPIGYLPLEMSRYRIHGSGFWSQLSPYRRVAIIVRMLSHAATLLTGEDKVLVENKIAELADWWGSELIYNQSASINALLSDLNDIGDCELATYFLSRTAEKARKLDEAWRWNKEHSLAVIAAANSELDKLKLSLAAANSELAAFTSPLGRQLLKLARKFLLLVEAKRK